MIFGEAETLDLDVFVDVATNHPRNGNGRAATVSPPTARPLYARRMIYQARPLLEPVGWVNEQHVTASLAGLPIGKDPDLLFAPEAGSRRGLVFVVEFKHCRQGHLETRDLGMALEHRNAVALANRGFDIRFVFATSALLTPLQRRWCLTDALAVVDRASDGALLARWILDKAGLGGVRPS